MHKYVEIEGDEVGNVVRRNIYNLYFHIPAGFAAGPVSAKGIYNILKGRSDPKLSTLVAIAEDRGIDIKKLFVDPQ